MRWVEAVAPAQQINSDERIYEAWGKLAKDNIAINSIDTFPFSLKK